MQAVKVALENELSSSVRRNGSECTSRAHLGARRRPDLSRGSASKFGRGVEVAKSVLQDRIVDQSVEVPVPQVHVAQVVAQEKT